MNTDIVGDEGSCESGGSSSSSSSGSTSIGIPTLRAISWPKYASKEEILETGSYIPCLISGLQLGSLNTVSLCIRKDDLMEFAFDDGENSHLSNLFKARLFRIELPDDNELVNNAIDKLSPGSLSIESAGSSAASAEFSAETNNRSSINNREILIYADHVSAHTVEQELHFVRFKRHIPFKTVSTVPVPVTLVGTYGCPGQLKGGHIELNMPTVDCEVIGEEFPPPFLVDCSKLNIDTVEEGLNYGRITLEDLQPLLDEGQTVRSDNGEDVPTVRFARKYLNDGQSLDETEVVFCYDLKKVPLQPLPEDYDDPNFYNRAGKKIHLTYTGYRPKQTTRG